jgi:hypothetical protein
MTFFRLILTAACMIGLAAGCYGGRTDNNTLSLRAKTIPNPAPPLSEFPNLSSAEDGTLILSWLDPSATHGRALRFASLREGRWSSIRAVTVQRSFNRHPAVLPAVAMLNGDSLVAYWTQMRNPGSHAEDVFASASRDGGLSWTKPVVVHRDRSESEHSLVSMAVVGQKKVSIVWLDGREEARSKKSMLMQATFDRRGVVGPEIILDADVCPCCPTSIAGVSDRLIVAYRDRTETNVRDISIVQFKNGERSEPRTLHHDGWRISGCPANGVDLGVDGSRVAAAWFTAADNEKQVRAAFSTDGGETFSRAIRIDEGRSAGRVSVALTAGKAAIVSWVEQADSTSGLMVRAVAPDGRKSSTLCVATVKGGTIGYPRIRPSGKQALITWVDDQKGIKKVGTAMVSFE